MNELFQDVRYGLRVLSRSRSFVLVVALTMALGTGANTAIFSVVNSVLFRPLPVKNPGQIAVVMGQQKRGVLENSLSVPEYRDIRDQTSAVFSGVIAYAFGAHSLRWGGQAGLIVTNFVSGDFFTVLGLKPALGRLMVRS